MELLESLEDTKMPVNNCDVVCDKYISIISHGHDDLIINNSFLLELLSIHNVHIYIKDNIGSIKLKNHCDLVGFNYLTSPLNIGFGYNNNIVFDHCVKNGMTMDDLFCVINPDVIIDKYNFELMISKIKNNNNELFTIDLYKDDNFNVNEPSLRYFSTWPGFFRMFINKPANIEYDKKQLKEFDTIDWAAGSFLVFKADLYKKLNGFSDKYFMYYEDVDICYRANKQYNQSVCFLKSVKAVHDGAYANRNIFSKHFRWYIKSFITFLISK